MMFTEAVPRDSKYNFVMFQDLQQFVNLYILTTFLFFKNIQKVISNSFFIHTLHVL